MDPTLDFLLTDTAPSPEDRQALRAALDADPALADAVAHWRNVGATLGSRLDAAVPDRETFVLYALDTAGRRDLLTEADVARLEAARADLEAALATYSSLPQVAQLIQEECRDFEACWRSAFDTPSTRPDRAPLRARTARPARWIWRGAAVFALVVFAALATLLVQRDAHMMLATTGPGEIQIITLADGSTVRLLENSQLSYPDPAEANPLARRVELEGRAFFEVVREQRGFSVETAEALTTVLGTSFGVVATEGATEVTLATGRVTLAPRTAETQFVTLEPGQRSRVVADGPPTPPQPVDLLEALTWTQQFICQDTPLTDLVTQLSLHYGVPVQLDAAFSDEKISGTFLAEESLETILERVAASVLESATLTRTDDGGFQLAPDDAE